MRRRNLLTVSAFLSIVPHWILRASAQPDGRSRFDPAGLARHDSLYKNTSLHDNDIMWDVDDGAGFRIPVEPTGRLSNENYWPNNGKNIPYSIAGFSLEENRKIENALRTITKRTSSCITFKRRNKEKEFIQFRPGRVCDANIGRIVGHITNIRLHAECFIPGILQHEIMHALGFFHEHNRPDRNRYIDIIFDNIRPGINNINYQSLSGINAYGLPYDLDSIMHYGLFEMSRNPSLRVIIPRKRDLHKIGQRRGLSFLYVVKLQLAYNCTLDDAISDVEEQKEHCILSNCANSTPQPSILEPFPIFSSEPMMTEQCSLQFNANCALAGYTSTNCTTTKALLISCTKKATSGQLQDMAMGMSKGPLRATVVSLSDGEQLSFGNFAVIRKQIIELQVFSCLSNRTTAKLPHLQFANLLSFRMYNCYRMQINRSDFAQSIMLRLVALTNTTIETLERETFTDIPALRLLSLETGFSKMNAFSNHVRDYLRKLHCDCEFSWFRRWWNSNPQLTHKALAREIVMIQESWHNLAWSKDEVYLPVDCSSIPFPPGAASIDFMQERFSINDDTDFGSDVSKCINTYSESMDTFPAFTEAPITSKQCVLQFSTNCSPYQLTRSNCTAYQHLEINCNRLVSSEEIRGMATLMAKTPPRATGIDLHDGILISPLTVAPVREQVVIFVLRSCRDSRGTSKLYELRLVNLLQFNLFKCYSLHIAKNDFQRTNKLRIIELLSSTVLTLEMGTFGDLPSLRVLAMEKGLNSIPLFSAETEIVFFVCTAAVILLGTDDGGTATQR